MPSIEPDLIEYRNLDGVVEYYSRSRHEFIPASEVGPEELTCRPMIGTASGAYNGSWWPLVQEVQEADAMRRARAAVLDDGEQWSSAEIVAFNTTTMRTPITSTFVSFDPMANAVRDNEEELDILRLHHRPPLPASGSSTGREPSLLQRVVGAVRGLGGLYGD